jgi:hypothetical protein
MAKDEYLDSNVAVCVSSERACGLIELNVLITVRNVGVQWVLFMLFLLFSCAVVLCQLSLLRLPDA